MNRYGDNLGAFYVVHPTFWLKVAETVIGAFLADGRFLKKLRYIESLRELFDHVDRVQLKSLPSLVFE